MVSNEQKACELLRLIASDVLAWEGEAINARDVYNLTNNALIATERGIQLTDPWERPKNVHR